jgi:hypothetical protein
VVIEHGGLLHDKRGIKGFKRDAENKMRINKIKQN